MSYSSDQFNKDWRYAIEKEFLKPDGSPYDYAENGLKEWGQELLNIPFPLNTKSHNLGRCAISDDGKRIAVSSLFDVAVIDLVEYKQTYLLKGHLSQVDVIVFRPGSSSQLVSAAFNNSAGSKPAEPQIILWDLNKHAPNVLATPEAFERLSRNAANSIIAEMKSYGTYIDVGASDQKSLAAALVEPISNLVTSKSAEKHTKLSGRLLPNFGSPNFSPSGKTLIYLPGKTIFRPPQQQEIQLYDVDRHEDAVVLRGHTDDLMWVGFNHDETLVGTSCWDHTFGIWNAKDGTRIHTFKTGLQNWAAGFSPDSKYFAGTSGEGKLHIYDLSTGTEHMNFDARPMRWNRALDWHPDGKFIALGGAWLGRVYLVDVNTGKAVQDRLLSTRDMKGSERQKLVSSGFLEIYGVRFIDQGRKLAYFTAGDGSIEVYDTEKHEKWRFARAGTMNPPEDEREVTSAAGFAMIVHEDRANKRVLLASVDKDAVRLWAVPMTS